MTLTARTAAIVGVVAMVLLALVLGVSVASSSLFTDASRPLQARVMLENEDNSVEEIQDTVAGLLREGANVALAYDDNAGSLTVSARTGGGAGTGSADRMLTVTVTQDQLRALGTTAVELIPAPAADQVIFLSRVTLTRPAGTAAIQLDQWGRLNLALVEVNDWDTGWDPWYSTECAVPNNLGTFGRPDGVISNDAYQYIDDIWSHPIAFGKPLTLGYAIRRNCVNDLGTVADFSAVTENLTFGITYELLDASLIPVAP